MGLGVTVTRQLAERLGDTLTLTSEPGKGSVFSQVIPIGMDITGQPLLNRNKTAGRRHDVLKRTPPLDSLAQFWSLRTWRAIDN